jgi:hypothetical protein
MHYAWRIRFRPLWIDAISISVIIGAHRIRQVKSSNLSPAPKQQGKTIPITPTPTRNRRKVAIICFWMSVMEKVSDLGNCRLYLGPLV